MRPLSAEQKSSLETAARLFEQHRSLVDGYLVGRGISPSTADRFRLGGVPDGVPGFEKYVGRLAIPAIGPKGNVYSIRFRALWETDFKYLGMDNIETRLFNVRAVGEASSVIAVIEGEIDAMSAEQAGVPAVGVPGVNNWKAHHRRLFDGYERVLVVGDPDERGQAFIKRLTNDLLSGVGVTLDPNVGDLNDYLVKVGEAGVRAVLGV